MAIAIEKALDVSERGIVTSSRDDIGHLEDSWEVIRTQAFPTGPPGTAATPGRA